MSIIEKSLDQKLHRILADPACNDFILADAKDADMGFGIAAPGPNHDAASGGTQPYRSLEQFRDQMREIVKQELVDIMLMSSSNSEALTIEERLFDGSSVTPAVRANDTTDIWCGMSGNYSNEPSLPFRSATIDEIQMGSNCRRPSEPLQELHILGANLGLYSITFNNHAATDREALEAYKAFRLEAEQKGFRHFLEVFAPNCLQAPVADVGRYVNDCIARCLGGVTLSTRPLFLKIPFFGRRAMEELVHYDPGLVVGILGGSAGTTHDAFQMLAEAKRSGARVALFGRKINHAEHQVSFLKCLRAVADGDIAADEAVRDYHGRLETLGISPTRELADDLQLTPR